MKPLLLSLAEQFEVLLCVLAAAIGKALAGEGIRWLCFERGHFLFDGLGRRRP